MRVVACLSILTFSTLAGTAAMAQTPAPPASTTTSPTQVQAPLAQVKPVVKTTCADYVGMDETVKPKFIYFAVGHGQHGKKEAMFEEAAIEKIKPELDQYCSINLTKSAYQKVMASSMASEPRHLAKPAKAR